MNLNIPEIIKEHHEAMIQKGFYSCPECNGTGSIGTMCDCAVCDGSGIDPNKNIGELLMLIVSELGEALEAHRNKRFAENIDMYLFGVTKTPLPNIEYFEKHIKDTFEDEIADVFLRLFDLCGYLGTDLDYIDLKNASFNNVGTSLYEIIKLLPVVSKSKVMGIYDNFYSALIHFSNHHNIPIEKHIKAKMIYNKTRPHKHGKEY